MVYPKIFLKNSLYLDSLLGGVGVDVVSPTSERLPMRMQAEWSLPGGRTSSLTKQGCFTANASTDGGTRLRLRPIMRTAKWRRPCDE